MKSPGTPVRPSSLALLVAMALALGAVALGPGRAAADNIYAYELDGRVWLSNYCPKKAKNCRVVVKGEPADRVGPVGSGSSSGGSSSGSSSRKRKAWHPPKTDNREGPFPQGDKPSEIDDIIALASQTYNIPEKFIRAVIEVESGYKIKALSYKGAMGLMQLMPGTAADMGVTNPWDPYQNIMGGTKFLRVLANRFNGDIPKVLAGYHAGGGAVSKAGGISHQGTDGYVRKVLKHYYRLKYAEEDTP